jgi:hypothetical protein
MIPGNQSEFKKVFYLRVYDPANNYSVIRLEESRDIRLSTTGIAPEAGELQPGDSLSFLMILNDASNYHKSIESQHRFRTPLLAGHYRFVLCYDPSGNPKGDMMYKYYLRDQPDANQKFWQMPVGGAEVADCALSIFRKDLNVLKIDDVEYKIIRKTGQKNMVMYSIDTVMVRVLEFARNDSFPSRDIEFMTDRNGERMMLSWFPSRKIRHYYEYSASPCHRRMTERVFLNDSTLQSSLDMLPEGIQIQKQYDAKGNIVSESRLTRGSDVNVTITYQYEEGKLVATQTREEKMERPFDPCLIYEKLIRKN